MISVCFQGKPFIITVIQVYVPITNAKEAEVEWFFWRPTRPSRTNTPKKYILFIIGEWNAKVRSQEIPGVTGKFDLGVKSERLTKFCQENALVIANTLFQQHKRRLHMDITKWSIPKSGWLYSLQPTMEKLYTVSKKKTGSWLWLRSWNPYCKIRI